MTNLARASLINQSIITVWFSPKETIRRIMPSIAVDERPVVLAGMLNGVALVIGWINPRDWSNWALLFLASLLGGPAIGFILLHLSGTLIRWTGSWLGGQASALEALTAQALSAIPRIVRLVVWIPLFLLYTLNSYILDTPVTIGAGRIYIFLWLLTELWSFVIFLKAISEVHRFSTGRALMAWALSWLVVTGPCWAIQIIGLAAEGLRVVFTG